MWSEMYTDYFFRDNSCICVKEPVPLDALTLFYATILTFNNPQYEGFFKTLGEKEKMLVPSIKQFSIFSPHLFCRLQIL